MSRNKSAKTEFIAVRMSSEERLQFAGKVKQVMLGNQTIASTRLDADRSPHLQAAAIHHRALLAVKADPPRSSRHTTLDFLQSSVLDL